MVAARRPGEGDGKVDHPAQKPVLLYRRPIENHLRPGELVYDPFAGSGTAQRNWAHRRRLSPK